MKKHGPTFFMLKSTEHENITAHKTKKLKNKDFLLLNSKNVLCLSCL